MMKIMTLSERFAGIDGHFWVVRNGEIVDPYFSVYDQIKQANGVNVSAPNAYCAASAETQNVMTSLLEEAVTEIFGTSALFLRSFEQYLGGPQPYQCLTNAMYEKLKNGGDLVFGSWGFKKQGKMWWEFGGKEWHSPMDFIQKCSPTFKKIVKTRLSIVGAPAVVISAEELAVIAEQKKIADAEKKKAADAEWDICITVAVQKNASKKGGKGKKK